MPVPVRFTVRIGDVTSRINNIWFHKCLNCQRELGADRLPVWLILETVQAWRQTVEFKAMVMKANAWVKGGRDRQGALRWTEFE